MQNFQEKEDRSLKETLSTGQNKTKINYWKVSTITLSLILIVFTVFFILNYLQLQESIKLLQNFSQTYTQKNQVDDKIKPPTDFTTSPTGMNENWKSFHFLCSACNTAANFTINYPEFWSLEEKIESGVKIKSITLAKNGHKIIIQEAFGGYDRCLYNDSKPFNGPSIKFVDFVEIKTKDAQTLRRPKTPIKNSQVSVCWQSNDGNFYTTSLYGNIKYYLPNNIDNPTLNEMDEIIKTLKLDAKE